MTPLSPRFALPALVLLLAAALPVWVRASLGPAPDACADTLGPGALAALPGTLSARSQPPDPGWPDRTLWIEGEIAAPVAGAPPLRFRIVRSSEPTSFYFEPVAHFSLNAAPDAVRGIRWLDAGPERLPVRWRYDTSDGVYAIRYLLAQDGRPILHPLAAGLADAAGQVWRGTSPVTLLLVDGASHRGGREEIEQAAEAWLTAAWHLYSAGCRG